MIECKVIGICDICKNEKLCYEEIMITESKQQKLELWCKECKDKIEKEYYAEQDYKFQEELYDDYVKMQV